MSFTYAETADRAIKTVSQTATSPATTSTTFNASAVSWGAIMAGAAAAAALSLILLMLGVGLGLSSISPWAHEGASAATLGVSTIVWVAVTQLLASAMGGYLAGRLRTKWVAVPTDEVYFRDTAHGFLAWSVASLATAALLTSVIGSIVGTGVQAGAAVAGGATSAAAGAAAAGGSQMVKADGDGGPLGYFVDSLFRKDMSATAAGSNPAASAGVTPGTAQPSTAPAVAASEAASTSEVTRIFMNSVRSGPLPAEDVRYVAQTVAQRTGLSQPEAEKRVTDTYTRLQAKLTDAQTAARDAADKARKASAYASLWLFISLLAGAFIASFSATFGGRQRDT